MPTPISKDFCRTVELVTSEHSPGRSAIGSAEELELLVASTHLELVRAVPALADPAIWRVDSFSWVATRTALQGADVNSTVQVWQVSSDLNATLALLMSGSATAVETIEKMHQAIDTIHAHAHIRACALVTEGRVDLDDLPKLMRSAVQRTQREQDTRAAQKTHLEKVTGLLRDLNPLDAAVKPTR